MVTLWARPYKRSVGKRSEGKRKHERSKWRSRSARASTCFPNEIHGLVRECECQKRWVKMTRIGSGAYGSAYHACSVSNSKDCEYVVKVQPNNATAKREFDAYMRLSGSSVVPKMHAAWLCRGRMYIVLDRMFECEVSLRALKDVLNRFFVLGGCMSTCILVT